MVSPYLTGLRNTRGELETAPANGLEPSAYINHLLTHIADTAEKLEALLPWDPGLAPIPKKT